MPSYGGVPIFGGAVTMRTADNPREKQVNAFFGLSGLETLDGGLRGRTTLVTGLLYGNTPSLLTPRPRRPSHSYTMSGVAKVLIDSLRTAWSEPSGSICSSLIEACQAITLRGLFPSLPSPVLAP